MEHRKKPSMTSAPGRPRTRATSRRRATCCGSGDHRFSQANGACSGSSSPATATSSSKACPRCRCAVWRTDELTPLAPHPNDPALAREASDETTEFLTTFTTTVPQGTPGPTVEDAKAREADRAHELAEQGDLRRLWTLPGQARARGLWRARDGGDARGPGVAPPERMDDHADHAAHRAPQRTGDHPQPTMARVINPRE